MTMQLLCLLTWSTQIVSLEYDLFSFGRKLNVACRDVTRVTIIKIRVTAKPVDVRQSFKFNFLIKGVVLD